MWKRIVFTQRVAAILLLTGAAGACADERNGITTVVPIERVEVTPAVTTLDVGETVQLTPRVLDASGSRLTYPVTWRTTGPATVSASGMVTALGPGTATISATSTGVSGTAEVRVEAVTAVSLSPSTHVLMPGETVRMLASVRDASGNPVNRVVSWLSDHPGVATVDAMGLVTAIGPGTAAIMASSEGVTGGAALVVLARVSRLTITPPAATLLLAQEVHLTATPLDDIGLALAREVTWTSSAPDVATVDARGVVTARAPGEAFIRAECEDVATTARITVQAPVSAVGVEPVATVIYMGKTLPLTATVFDANGAMLTRPVLWASSSPGVATVDAQGTVRGLAAGTTTITATSAGIVGAANVLVLAPVAAIELTPGSASLLTAETLQLNATLRDASGTTLLRPINWTSDNPAVGTVSSAGLVSGIAAGQTTIRATSEGVGGSMQVTILARIASVTVTPATTSVLIGNRIQLSAVAADADGNVLDRTILWSSSRPDVATVNAGGEVTAIAAGISEVTATSGQRAGRASVTVLMPVAQLQIALAPDSVDVDEVIQLAALAMASDGTHLQRPVEWTSSDPTVATIDKNGVLTAIAPGSIVLMARSEDKSCMKSIRVMIPVASVTVDAPSTTVAVNQSLALSGIARSATGVTLSRALSWTSSNPAVATVNASGTVTGRKPGEVVIGAWVSGRHGTLTITVVPGVASVHVASTTTTLSPDSPIAHLTAELRDGNGVVVHRQVAWTSSDTNVVTVTATGPVTADALRRGSGSATVTAVAEGQQGTVVITVHGPPTGTEETANNLSWPAIFVDGYTLAGEPVGADAGLRPLPDEGIAVDTLPFWYHLNKPDLQGLYYLQGVANTWRAEWLDGSSQAMTGVSAYWGDNLTHHTYSTHSVIHVEVALYALAVPTLRGFNMVSLGGTGPDEVFAADGTTSTFQPMVYTVHPRLLVERIDSAGGTPLFTVVDKLVADGLGQDGPGYYRGELNKAGKVVYGYNLKIQDITVPEGTTKYGWYRLSFILEDNVTVAGTTLPRRVSLDALVASTDPEEPTFVPRLSSDHRRTYLDVFISSSSGGHK